MAAIDFLGMTVPEEAMRLLALELVLGAALVFSVVLAALRRGSWHHWIMLVAFGLDELVAKPLMIQRVQLGVVGEFPYDGTDALPHIILSVVAAAFGLVTIVIGFRFRIKKERKMFMPPKGRKVHRLVGAVFLVSWFASLALGLRIFLQFYSG